MSNTATTTRVYATPRADRDVAALAVAAKQLRIAETVKAGKPVKLSQIIGLKSAEKRLAQATAVYTARYGR